MGYEQIPGYSGFLPLYAEWVKTAPHGAIAVEVGVALGHSIAYLARCAIDANRRDLQLYAVDSWAGAARNGEQQELADAAGGDFNLFCAAMVSHAPEELELVRVIRASSIFAARMFPRGSVDLVLIDAAHDYGSVLQDIQTWLPLVKTDGIIAGDDHEPNYPGVERAVKQVFGGDYRVEGTTWRARA